MIKRVTARCHTFVACLISCLGVLFNYVFFADISGLFQHVTLFFIRKTPTIVNDWPFRINDSMKTQLIRRFYAIELLCVSNEPLIAIP